MPSQPITNFCMPAQEAPIFPLFIQDVFPGGKRGSISRGRHGRKRSCDVELVNRGRDVPSPSPKKDRRRTIEFRILPQRIPAPISTASIRSIWFRSQNEQPDFGVALTDLVDERVEKPIIVAPEERVFQGFCLDCEEIQFSILWPGYGHVSWIASIPINTHEGGSYHCENITRRLLASAVAQHFRAFMTNHSHLRFPLPDPSWRIMNERESGIGFEDLRLTRVFSCKDETGKFSSWQAEILVVGDPSAYTH